jgi:hypothetical protein
MTRCLDFASAPTSEEAQKVALDHPSHLANDFDGYHYSSMITACSDTSPPILCTSVFFYVSSSQREIGDVQSLRSICAARGIATKIAGQTSPS